MDTKSKEFLIVCKECDLNTREDKNILREGFAAFTGTRLKPKSKQEEAERIYREKRFWNSLTVALENEDLNFDNFMRAVAICADLTHRQLDSSRTTVAKIEDREDEFSTFTHLADSCLRYYKGITGENYDFSMLETGIFPEM